MMLRVPALHMRNARGKRFAKTIRRKFNTRNQTAARKDLRVSLRDAFYIQTLSWCAELKETKSDGSEMYVTVQISELEDGGEHGRRVFFKDDQDRFPHRYTLKLKTSSKYIISVAAEPAQELTYVKIGGCRYDVFQIINDPYSNDNEENIIYSLH